LEIGPIHYFPFRKTIVEEVVTALLNKDTETTKIISDKLEFAENTIKITFT